jgi:hypothetical protein
MPHRLLKTKTKAKAHYDFPAITLPLLLLQRSGGVLPEAQARSLLVGIGPAIPPPTLAGLPAPRPTVTQQTWQSAPQIPGVQAAPAQGPGGGGSAAFPPMPAADAQRYRDVFAQLDADRDGYILVINLPPVNFLSEHSVPPWDSHLPRIIIPPHHC